MMLFIWLMSLLLLWNTKSFFPSSSPQKGSQNCLLPPQPHHSSIPCYFLLVLCCTPFHRLFRLLWTEYWCPLKFTFWNSNCECYGIWGWGLWEVIWIQWGHVGWGPHDEIRRLERGYSLSPYTQFTLSVSIHTKERPRKHTVRRWLSANWKTSSHQYWILLDVDSRLSSLQH